MRATRPRHAPVRPGRRPGAAPKPNAAGAPLPVLRRLCAPRSDARQLDVRDCRLIIPYDEFITLQHVFEEVRGDTKDNVQQIDM